MIIENKSDFYKAIKENVVFKNYKFNLIQDDLIIKHFNSEWIVFEGCEFDCELLMFSNLDSDLVLEFNNCVFNCNVKFQFCEIDEISFSNTKYIKSLIVSNPLNEKFSINKFVFKNDNLNEEQINSTNFCFQNVNFKQYFEFNNINNIKGIFNFSNNNIGDELYEGTSSCVFNSSKLGNIRFENNEFNTFTSFKKSKFYFNKDNFNKTGNHWNEPKFWNNNFKKVNFSQIELFCKIEFDNCDFSETTLFEDCVKNLNSNLKIIACKFEKYTLFDNSFFDKIEISHTKFVEKVSFENFTTNFFKIHQVSFLGSAFFDDLNKDNNKSIENWDRKTLRSIKRELVSTHNQIDYLRFKAYELEAYKKEKGKSWKDNFILNLNSFSSSNGLDWVKALRFIFLTSLINYLFYLITYLIGVKSVVPSNFPNSVEEFLVYYLKFINPLMFLKSPIEDAEKYFFPLLFLLIGKILISYGIYQLIQAFKKKKKNGD